MNKVNDIVINQYLSEKWKMLPCGIIDKNVTGVGATHLELHSQRNSIVVVPTKVLASTKAKSSGAYYVGSSTMLFPNGFDKQEFIKWIKKNSEHKKIVVVADSLIKVIDALGPKVYSEYFCMVDEIDSFQSESTYRQALEICLDYALKFDKMCLVSATLDNMSDPRILDLPRYRIKLNNPLNRCVWLANYDDAKRAVLNYILSVFGNNPTSPESKLLIAYNSLKAIKNVINSLPEVLKRKAKILCSSSSRPECTIQDIDYYAELNKGQLPGSINFCTSAYFVGVDIYEKAEVLVVTDSRYPHSLISTNKMIQVAGRIRNGSGSFILIYNRIANPPKEIKAQNLIKLAQEEVKYCKSKSGIFSSGTQTNSRKVLLNCFKGTEFVRLDYNDEYKVSYLRIDSFLQSNRYQRKFYGHPKDATMTLRSEGFTVKKITLAEMNPNIKKLKNLPVKEMVKNIISIHSNPYCRALIEPYGRGLKILETYDVLLKKKKTKKEAKRLLMDNASSKVQLGRFMDFVALAKDDIKLKEFYKQCRPFFDVGRTYTTAELISTVKKLSNSSGLHTLGIQAGISRNKVHGFIKTYFEVQRTTEKRGDKRVNVQRIVSRRSL